MLCCAVLCCAFFVFCDFFLLIFGADSWGSVGAMFSLFSDDVFRLFDSALSCNAVDLQREVDC